VALISSASIGLPYNPFSLSFSILFGSLPVYANLGLLFEGT
jgi:hypothetical protein